MIRVAFSHIIDLNIRYAAGTFTACEERSFLPEYQDQCGALSKTHESERRKRLGQAELNTVNGLLADQAVIQCRKQLHHEGENCDEP
ncbi:MAG: hypothetical protein IKP72_06780 [Clostridia bacterium]|nr:hypothetical protein [Clostridia bacterium]